MYYIPYYSKEYFNYIIIIIKNIPDITPIIAELICRAVTPGKKVIVLIQNSLNIKKLLFKKFLQKIILSGISCVDLHEIAPGVIKQVNHDWLIIRAFPNPTPIDADIELAARDFSYMYGAAGKTDCKYIFTDKVPFY